MRKTSLLKDDIGGNSHKTEPKTAETIQPIIYKVKITPLFIYGPGGVHTHTHPEESDFKKPGVRRLHSVHGFKKNFIGTTFHCLQNQLLT